MVDVAPQTDGVGTHHRRTIGIADPGHLDAHLDVVTDGFERIDRPVGEHRRALEALRGSEPQRRQAGRSDRLGHLAERRLAHALGWREPAEAQGVTFGVDVVEEHVDDHGHAGPGLDRVGDADRGLVRGSGGQQFDDHRCRGGGAVAVDDRVVELVDADVSGLGCVHDRRRRADVDRAVAGDTDRRHGDRLAVGVVVVDRDLDRNRRPGACRDRVVDGDGRVVDPVVVGFAHLGFARCAVVGAGGALAGLAGVDDVAVVAEHEDALRVLLDRLDAPRVDTPDEVAGDVVDPHQVDGGGDRQGGVHRDGRRLVLEDLAGPPVEPDHRAGTATHDRCCLAGDGEEVAPAEVEAGDGGGVGDTVRRHAPQVVVGAHPTAVTGRSGHLHQDLAGIGSGVERVPATVAQSGSPTGHVDQQRNVADQRQQCVAVDPQPGALRGRRRRPDEVAVDQRPDRAVGGDLGRIAGLDGERDRFAVAGHHVGFVVAGVDHDQAGLPDTCEGASGAQCRQAERCAETEIDRVDRPRFSGGVVEHVGARAALRDRQLLAREPGLETRQRPAAVPVDQHHPPRRLVHEPPGRTRRRGIDRRQTVGAHHDDDGEQRQQRRRDRGDGLAPGHGRQRHGDLNGTASGGFSQPFIGTKGPELKKVFRSRTDRDPPGRDVTRPPYGSLVLLSMEIVVRTPHGDADVSIVSAPAGTTLGDVVAAVTGQAMPRLVQVDDHVVDATTPLDDAGLLEGSIVTSEPMVAAVTSDADVDLVQIAGHGAGQISRLGPGRYRIGPGRRSSADELTLAPVEHTMFELVVEAHGRGPPRSPSSPGSPTAATDPATDVLVDGIRVDHPTRWSNGTLSVAGRAFQIDTPVRSDPPRTLSAPDRDGTVEFSRPPRRPSSAPRRPVVDAVRDATGASPTLWERRPGQPDAFALPIGVRDEGRTEVVTIDLSAERGVAIAGTESFRSALARTLVIETATLHGPADVDLVVLTDPDRVAQWDWAKWLPHMRLDGTPAIWSSARDIARWVRRCDRAGRPHRGPRHTSPWRSSTIPVSGTGATRRCARSWRTLRTNCD